MSLTFTKSSGKGQTSGTFCNTRKSAYKQTLWLTLHLSVSVLTFIECLINKSNGFSPLKPLEYKKTMLVVFICCVCFLYGNFSFLWILVCLCTRSLCLCSSLLQGWWFMACLTNTHNVLFFSVDQLCKKHFTCHGQQGHCKRHCI